MPGMELQYPWALLLLVLVPVALAVRPRTETKLPFSAVGAHLQGLGPGFWKRHYEAVLFAAAGVCLCLALANPGYSRKSVEEYIESKWIILTLDLSGSMMRQVSRSSRETVGDVALNGLESFIDLRREGDYIGLVAFSSFAKLLAPLTFDKALLKKKLELVRSRNQSRIFRELGAGGGTNASEAVWLALSVFFSMLPKEHRLNVEEIARLRTFLLGEPGSVLDIPLKLREAPLGTGMAVILFTDGRIEPQLRAHVRRGPLPNMINVIAVMKALGIRFYIIAVGGQVDTTVVQAMAADSAGHSIGRIFSLSRGFDARQIREVYREIDKLESNRNLLRISVQPHWTRVGFSIAGLLLMLAHLGLRTLPRWRRI